MRELTGVMAGAGYFAAFQAEAWRRVSGVRIAAVADVDDARARAFAEKWGIGRSYASVEEMLEREGRLDFLDIATRPESHADLARNAASRGIAVLCQKPLAPTYREAVEMTADCRARGVRLLVHENWRWQPWYREIRRLIDSGLVAKPQGLRFRMRTGDGTGPQPYPLQPYFRDMPRLLIHETAVHFLDTFRFLAGEIRSVRCRTRRINPLIQGEDQARIEIAFESGATGEIDADRTDGPVPAPMTLGTLDLDGIHLDEEGRLFILGAPHEFPSRRGGYKGDSVHATQEHLAHGLRSGEACESEAERYLATLRVVEACYRSAAEGGREVEMKAFEP